MGFSLYTLYSEGSWYDTLGARGFFFLLFACEAAIVVSEKITRSSRPELRRSIFAANNRKKKLSGTQVRAHFGQSNFPFFQQKRKKEVLLTLIIFAYFKVRAKIEKKKMVRKLIVFSFF